MVKYKLLDNDDKEVECGYFDGYFIADRFLEGCFFKVTLTEDKTDFIVEADYATSYYLKSCKASVSEWEEEIRKAMHKRDVISSEPNSNVLDIEIFAIETDKED